MQDKRRTAYTQGPNQSMNPKNTAGYRSTLILRQVMTTAPHRSIYSRDSFERKEGYNHISAIILEAEVCSIDCTRPARPEESI